MPNTRELFLNILCAYLHKTAPSQTAADLGALILLSKNHKVFPIVYSVLKKYPCGFTTQEIASLRPAVMLESAAGIQRENAFLKLYSDLRENGISPIVVKGIILGSVYPEKNTRFSSDEDLLFTPETLQKAEYIFTRHDLVRNDAAEDDTVWGYRNSANGLYIEAHTKLFPEYPSHNIIMNKMFENATENSVYINANDIDIRTLEPTFHLLFLVLHSFKHFIYCGFGIRQVMDFIIFAKENKDKINSEKIVSSLSNVNALGFFDGLLAICEKYFGEAPEELGFGNYTPEKYDPSDLMEDILSGGAYGNSSPERLHSSKMTLAASEGERGASSLASLLPPLGIMKSSYTYLEKYPFLLPYSWGQRIIEHLKKDKKERSFNAAETIEIGKERLRMMKKYKIIDK